MAFDHERRWHALVGPEQDLETFLNECLQSLFRGGESAAVVADDFLHVVDMRRPLMFSAILRKSAPEAIAVYPYTESPYTWPLTIMRVEAEGPQATLLGTVGPAAIAVFHTLHVTRGDRCVPEHEVNVQVSAIAYALEEERLQDGMYAADFAAYAPLRALHPDAPFEDIEVHTVIDAAQRIDFRGIPIDRYAVTLARLPDGPLRCDVYANPAVCGHTFEVGARVRGHFWLFGMVL